MLRVANATVVQDIPGSTASDMSLLPRGSGMRRLRLDSMNNNRNSGCAVTYRTNAAILRATFVLEGASSGAAG